MLALDVGTSSVRSMLFDGAGRELPGGEVQLRYQPRVGAGGAAEVGVEALFELCTRTLDGAVRRARRVGEVEAVGVSTFWHGLAAADARMRPLTPVILWSDTRAGRQAERLRRELDQEAYRRRDGCPLHASYWPAKLAWLKAEEPALFGRARHWVSFCDLLYQRLFGELGTSASMASGTGLRRLQDGAWDLELLERLGVPPQRLPPPAAEMSGLRTEFARRWPALARVPWLTAAGDGALANLGSGCVAESHRALTVGTSGALRTMTAGRPDRLAAGLWCYVLDERRHLVGGALSNGGNLYAWMVRVLAVRERGLEARLRRMAPAATGLTFLPLLAGERAPGWAAQASGAIGGLTQTTNADQIVRAGLEAVALRFARLDAALDESVPGARMLVASGAALAASPVWAQIMADAIGKPLLLGRQFEASARGAALFALERLGGSSERPPGRGRTFEPRPEAHRAYRASYLRQGRLYDALVRDRLLDTEGTAAHLGVWNGDH